MLELILDRHVIYVLMGMSAFAGVLAKAVVGRTLRKLVAAAESMGKSNHPLMRLVRAKFEHTCMISEKVENVGVFVDKYLYEYRVGGVRLHAWRRLQMAGAGLCLILGGVGAIISYRIKGATEQTAMIGGTGAALALIVFLVHMLTDEEYRLDAVRNYMVDYLENIYQHRYEKTYKKEVLAEAARSEEARMGENMRTTENERVAENERMTESARMVENERMAEANPVLIRSESENLTSGSGNRKNQESEREFPGSMDSLLWAMYKTEPLQVEDERKVTAATPVKEAGKNVEKGKEKAGNKIEKVEKVKKAALSQETGKTEKTTESEPEKAQDEAGRNQRIREILEEFMA